MEGPRVGDKSAQELEMNKQVTIRIKDRVAILKGNIAMQEEYDDAECEE